MCKDDASEPADLFKLLTLKESTPNPVQPPGDPAWQKQETKAGTIPDGKTQYPAPILSAVNSTVPSRKHLKDRVYKLDKALGEPEYQRVYEAYARTGKVTEIAEATSLDVPKVNHLIDRGIMRLGLPPIREHATDLAEVNSRLRTAISLSDKSSDNNFLAKLPEIQKTVTDRAVQEAAGAQCMLETTMSAANIFMGYVTEVFKVAQRPGGYAPPDVITNSSLETLSKTINNLTRAMDAAVRLNRLTAGEPERNLGIEVSIMVNKMTYEELQYYTEHKQLPARLRLGAGSVANVGNDGEDDDILDADFSEQPLK